MAKARWKWVFTVVSAMFILKFPIACGMNFGQKMKAGDNRTPEGIFKVVSKEPAAHWTYDFGKGPVEGAYGPLFIRLSTPGFKGIGIHGTHDPATVPGRETHGCIRCLLYTSPSPRD